jgi:flagellar basal-body rod modification protein FlgD
MEPVAPSIPKHLMREADENVKARNTMGKDDFLKLLMTQLQHQDPVNPMNHEQFSAQLAQFSQLEQLSNIGKGIESLNGGKADEAKLQALGLIGKEVRASGSRVDLQGGQAVALKYLPDAEATPVKATVFDTSGRLVREMELAGKSDANGSIVWDGMDDAGNPAPTGKYSFRVYGVDRNGQSKEMGSEVSGKVTGVETEGNEAVLIVDTGSGPTKIELSKVARVSLPADKPAAPVKGAAPEAAKTLPKVIELGSLEDAAEEAASEEASVFDEPSRHDISEIIGRLGR